MVNILKFPQGPSTLRVESQPANLTEEEVKACEIARALREAFTDEEVENIKLELEAELDNVDEC